jgi:hypothetical protein
MERKRAADGEEKSPPAAVRHCVACAGPQRFAPILPP